MAYRDDHMALQARADALERELAETKERLEREQTIGKARAEALRLRIHELEGMRRLHPPPVRPERHRPWVAVGRVCVAAGVVLLMMIAMWSSLLSRRHPVSRAPLSGPPSPIYPTFPTFPTFPLAPPEGPHALATWNAVVASASGISIQRGARCTVMADLAARGREVDVRRVDIGCSGHAIYRWSDPGAVDLGVDLRACVATEERDEADGWRYRLTCRDEGPRRAGGRPRMTIDSPARRATIWSEGSPTIPETRIDLDLDDASAPWHGEPLVGH